MQHKDTVNSHLVINLILRRLFNLAILFVLIGSLRTFGQTQPFSVNWNSSSSASANSATGAGAVGITAGDEAAGSNVTITRPSNLGTNPQKFVATANWPTVALFATTSTSYVEFPVSAVPGYSLAITGVQYYPQKNATGGTAISTQTYISIDNKANWVSGGSFVSVAGSTPTLSNFSWSTGNSVNSGTIYVRLYIAATTAGNKTSCDLYAGNGTTIPNIGFTVTGTTTVSTPSTQASNITFPSIGTTSLTISWTNGSGASRLVKLNTSNSFTAPSNGTAYSASTVYAGGEQVVYAASGSSVSVTGLTSGVTYYATVYEYNGSGTSTIYNTTSPPNASQITNTAATPSVTTTAISSITSSSASGGGNVTADGGATVTERGVVYGATANPTTSNTKVVDAAGGTGSYTSSITGLTAATTYHVRAYAISSNGTGYGDDVQFSTRATQPTSQASTLTTSALGATSITISWTSGNGSNRIVIAKAGSSVDQDPVSGTSYTASTVFGSGTQLGVGNYIVFNGTSNTVSLTGLTAGTMYYFAVYEFNGSAGTENYLLTPATASFSSLATAPATSATSVLFSSVNATSFTIGWTNGNGADRVVLVKSGVAVDGTPTGGTAYTPNTVFGYGSQIGTANYVVFSGTGNSVTVTGLTASTAYYVSVFEYNGTGVSTNYRTSNPATGNQTTTVLLVDYYNVQSSDVTLVANWGTATDGSGSNPLNFTTPGQVFHIQNASPSMSQPLTVSGTSSKVVIGDGINPITFTIPSLNPLTATVDVLASGILKVQNETGLVFETLNSASTVEFDGSAALVIPAGNYGNIASVNDAGATRTLASSGTIRVAGTFTPGAATYTVMGSTVNFNGTSAQTIPTFTFNNLAVSNTSGVSIPSSPAYTVTLTGTGTLSISSGCTLTVNGTLDNQATGAITLTGTLAVNGTYIVDANWTIPSATYNSGSTLYVKGNTGSSTYRLPQPIGGNLIWECTGQTSNNTFLNTTPGLTTAIGGNFTLNSTGTAAVVMNTAGNNKVLSIAGDFIINGGTLIMNGTSPSSGAKQTISAKNIIINHGSIDVGGSTGSTASSGLINLTGDLYLNNSDGIMKISGGSSSTGTVTFDGTSTQAISVNGTTNFPSTIGIACNKSSGALNLSSDLTVNGSLTLTSGLLFLGDHNLSLSSASVISGTPSASSMIVTNGSGSVYHSLSATGNFTFPVGDNTGTAEYTPAVVSVTAATGFSSARIGINVKNSKYSGISRTSDYLDRYWTVSPVGITDGVYSVDLSYAVADIIGTEGSVYGGNYAGSTWSNLGLVTAATHKIIASGLTNPGVITGVPLSTFSVTTAFTVSLIPEGYYSGSGTLAMRDTFKVYIANMSSPWTYADSGTVVIDSVSFNGTVNFNHLSSGTYYIVVKHQSTIETWSKSGGESFTAGSPISYDFTASQSQALGGNMVLKGDKYCLYSGDTNQDNFIDNNDLLLIDNDAFNFAGGYLITDLNGDQFVDNNDLLICDNNAFNFIGAVTPAVKRDITKPRVHHLSKLVK